MKHSLRYLVLNLVVAYNLAAQSNIQITGYVTDQNTGAYLDAVSIYLENTNLGTITNEDGEFKFIVPNSAGKLVFSYLGYATKNLDLKDIDVSKSIEIKLIPHDEILEEILLSSVPVSDLLTELLDNSKNRAKDSYLLTGYNREILKTNEAYCFFADGIVDYHITGKGKKMKTKMDLKSSRVIDRKCENMDKFLKGNPFYVVFYLANLECFQRS